ncbi:MAG: sulfotransferase family protein, partial [Promethearchaeota archaeon]
ILMLNILLFILYHNFFFYIICILIEFLSFLWYYFHHPRFEEKIFGIGLSKTGTSSLDSALKVLGFKTKHYPQINGLYEMVDKYDALTDVPIVLNFKKLDKEYPNSKFILTIRDIDSWLKSCKLHFSRVEKNNIKSEIRKLIYGVNGWDEESFKKAYHKHFDDVKNYFKNRPEDLLILNIIKGEGWEKLCKFLCKKIPNKPFPHKNISKFNLKLK